MASPLPPDPYAALGVPKDANLATIRSAHRKLVLTCHPDKVYDDSIKAKKAEQFHLVQQAYEILSDETRRARYDDQVRLAELRAEAFQTGNRSRPVYEFVPRPSATTTYETRGNAVYEERVPRPRSYEEDHFSPRFEEVRSSGRKYDIRQEERPSRRSSGRVAEEKIRKAREDEDDERARKAAREREQRAAERASYAERKKTRDRGRRQEYDRKREPRAYVDSDSSSDSDTTERFMRPQEPRRRYEETRRSEYEDRPRRSRDYDSEHVDEREKMIRYKVSQATEHIERSSGRPRLDDRRSSSAQIPVQSSRVPPPPPVDVRRSSGRSHVRRESSPLRSSAREHRVPEMPETYGFPLRSKPPMPPATTDPASLSIPTPRGPPPTMRAATTDSRSSEPRQPTTIKRSQTSPLAPKHKNSDIHDSGYSSGGTPEMMASHSPSFTSTKYAVVEEPEEDDDIGPRVRAISPRSHHRSERPLASPRTSSSARPPPPMSRSATYSNPEPPKSQPSRPHVYVRTHSNRTPTSPTPPLLFAEVSTGPKLSAADIRYSRGPRRGSAESPREYKDTPSKSSLHRGASYVKQTVY